MAKSKGKGGKREVNPTDAFRKLERNKEKKRNKLERQKIRADASLRKDPLKIREELEHLKGKAQHGLVDTKDVKRITQLETMWSSARIRLEAEQYSTVYRPPPQLSSKQRKSNEGSTGRKDGRRGKVDDSCGGAIVVLQEGEADLTSSTAAGTVLIDPALQQRGKPVQTSKSAKGWLLGNMGESEESSEESEGEDESEEESSEASNEEDEEPSMRKSSGLDGIVMEYSEPVQSVPLHQGEVTLLKSELPSVKLAHNTSETSARKARSTSSIVPSVGKGEPAYLINEGIATGAATTAPSSTDGSTPHPTASSSTPTDNDQHQSSSRPPPKGLAPGTLPPLPPGLPPKHAATSGRAIAAVVELERKRQLRKRRGELGLPNLMNEGPYGACPPPPPHPPPGTGGFPVGHGIGHPPICQVPALPGANAHTSGTPFLFPGVPMGGPPLLGPGGMYIPPGYGHPFPHHPMPPHPVQLNTLGGDVNSGVMGETGGTGDEADFIDRATGEEGKSNEGGEMFMSTGRPEAPDSPSNNSNSVDEAHPPFQIYNRSHTGMPFPPGPNMVQMQHSLPSASLLGPCPSISSRIVPPPPPVTSIPQQGQPTADSAGSGTEGSIGAELEHDSQEKEKGLFPVPPPPLGAPSSSIGQAYSHVPLSLPQPHSHLTQAQSHSHLMVRTDGSKMGSDLPTGPPLPPPLSHDLHIKNALDLPEHDKHGVLPPPVMGGGAPYRLFPPPVISPANTTVLGDGCMPLMIPPHQVRSGGRPGAEQVPAGPGRVADLGVGGSASLQQSAPDQPRDTTHGSSAPDGPGGVGVGKGPTIFIPTTLLRGHGRSSQPAPSAIRKRLPHSSTENAPRPVDIHKGQKSGLWAGNSGEDDSSNRRTNGNEMRTGRTESSIDADNSQRVPAAVMAVSGAGRSPSPLAPPSPIKAPRGDDNVPAGGIPSDGTKRRSHKRGDGKTEEELDRVFQDFLKEVEHEKQDESDTDE